MRDEMKTAKKAILISAIALSLIIGVVYFSSFIRSSMIVELPNDTYSYVKEFRYSDGNFNSEFHVKHKELTATISEDYGEEKLNGVAKYKQKGSTYTDIETGEVSEMNIPESTIGTYKNPFNIVSSHMTKGSSDLVNNGDVNIRDYKGKEHKVTHYEVIVPKDDSIKALNLLFFNGGTSTQIGLTSDDINQTVWDVYVKELGPKKDMFMMTPRLSVDSFGDEDVHNNFYPIQYKDINQ